MVKPSVLILDAALPDSEKIKILYDYIYELSDIVDFLLKEVQKGE